MTTFVEVLVIYGLYFGGSLILILAGFTVWHWHTNRRPQKPAARRVEIDFDRVTQISAARSFDRQRGAA